LDGDGLLRYFPSDTLPGSEALTSYVLSITAEAGLPVPEGPKARMIGALTAVVEGRLERDSGDAGDKRFLRLAALGALARNGAATPAMLGQIGIPPADMPTSALADWLVALDRVKADPAMRAEAERVLRSRIVFEGSRFDLVDGGTAPWWMMVSTDEMALRALHAILGRPGWQDDAPRMMIGAALRQRRGHWDTTPANAWGSVAARRFAALYPPGAVAGTTTLRLGPATRTQAWPSASPVLRLPLPATQTPLVMSQSGGAGPWAQVSLTAAVPLTAPLNAGYKMTKQVEVIQAYKKGELTRGDVVKVTITVDATAERNWVVVNDPVPTGATVIGGLGGQSQMLGAAADSGSGVQPSYIERGRDAWRGYFAWVPRGTFTVSYVMRMNSAGVFNLPATRVEAMYSPEIRAQVPNGVMSVAQR
jgi:uncharacterized protein YfaS (alpha-2-macroglobulin family)